MITREEQSRRGRLPDDPFPKYFNPPSAAFLAHSAAIKLLPSTVTILVVSDVGHILVPIHC
jgi:hypothetical protein